MCGIAGYLDLNLEKAASPEVLERMAASLAHRGPDGEGIFIRHSVGLAHRRLSIIDLTTGDQPMGTADGRLTIVTNSEIYNYIELRETLKSLGHVFRTASDTEVILEAYREWGTDCLRELNAMWAMAIWDNDKKELLLSRDRLGEKPLYYAEWDGTLVFGSEIKAILACGVPKEMNQEILEVYLTLGYVPAPHTAYKNIFQLPAGHFLIARDARYHVRPYWSFPYVPESDMRTDEQAVHEEFSGLFHDATRIRMRSDVPYGAFLSGGLDSASIVAEMSASTAVPVSTFTIGFDEQDYDERELARKVAEAFGTDHHEEVVQPDTLEVAIERVLDHYDEPFGDSSAIPTGQVSRFAAKQVKVALTGDGGDEVLSGYTIYQGDKFGAMYRKLPSGVASRIPDLAAGAARFASGAARDKLERVRRVSHAALLPFEEQLLAKESWLKDRPVRDLMDNSRAMPVEDFLHDLMAGCRYRDSFYKLMYYHFHLSLPGDMLTKVDRMSMAFGLETRVPFLDHRLVELMAGVDKSVKMKGLERKSVLRAVMGTKLPSSVLAGGKKGFTVPLRRWFQQDSFQPTLASVLDLERAGFRKDELAALLEDNASGRKDYGNFIWMLLLFDRWLQRNDFG